MINMVVRNRKKTTHTGTLLLSLILLLLLSACSTITPQGGTEEEVSAELSLSPATARQGQSTSLIAQIIGLKKLSDVELYYELKKDGTGKSKLIKVDGEVEGKFIGQWEPEEAGMYAVIIHIINPDIHVTVKKEVTVEP